MVNAYYSRGRCGKGPVFLLAAFPGALSPCTVQPPGKVGLGGRRRGGGGGTFLLNTLTGFQMLILFRLVGAYLDLRISMVCTLNASFLYV